jgi:assimilatory nitrate reductase catalytic subunit
VVRAQVSETQRPGSVFAPMHWNDQYSSKAVVDALVAANVDPFSGQPEFKYTAVSIRPYDARWYGFLLSRRKLKVEQASYWAVSRGNGLWRYELAGIESASDWAAFARALLCETADEVNWIEYFDKAKQRYRGARLANNRLDSCIFIGPEPALPEREWLASLFEHEAIDQKDRVSLLIGKPVNSRQDAGKVVCACFGVGINTIRRAITENGATTAEAIGECVKAGTNCGSCVPELKKILLETVKA